MASAAVKLVTACEVSRHHVARNKYGAKVC